MQHHRSLINYAMGLIKPQVKKQAARAKLNLKVGGGSSHSEIGTEVICGLGATGWLVW